jgi:hypothetical protein
VRPSESSEISTKTTKRIPTRKPIIFFINTPYLPCWLPSKSYWVESRSCDDAGTLESLLSTHFYVKKGGHLGVVIVSQLLRHFLTLAPRLAGSYLPQPDKLRMPQVIIGFHFGTSAFHSGQAVTACHIVGHLLSKMCDVKMNEEILSTRVLALYGILPPVLCQDGHVHKSSTGKNSQPSGFP